MNTIAIPRLVLSKKSAALGILLGTGVVLFFTLQHAFAQVEPPAGPTLQATATVTVPGADTLITGTGFKSGETVHVHFGAQTAEVTASDSGTIATSLPIPSVPASLQFVSAFGTSSGLWALTYLWVAGFSPTVEPGSYYVLPGEPLHFAGSGFAPDETVRATYGVTELALYTTDGNGNFSGPASSALPLALANTTADITFTGETSDVTHTVTLTVGQLYPSITPASWYTGAGSTISITGAGFAAGEDIVVHAGATSASTTADVAGNFSLPAFVLPSAGGTTVTLTATGQGSGAIATADIFVFSYAPWLTYSTYWDLGGSPLTIFGNSFAPSEVVTLTSGTTNVGSTTADASGNFAFFGAIPFAPSGTITITGIGQQSGAEASAPLFVAPVFIDLQFQNYAGAPGSSVTIIGHGYLPNEPVEVKTDRTGDTVVATFTSDAAGNIGGIYTIPSDFVMGPLNITVTGTHSFAPVSVLFFVTGG